MRRRIARAGHALVGLLMVVAPVRADVAPLRTSVAYVAAMDTTRLGDPGAVEPDGIFWARSTGNRWTLTVDDLGTPDGGKVWVSVSGDSLHFNGCLRVRTARTFTGVSPEEDLLVGMHNYLPYEAPGLIRGPGCRATSGVATFTGATPL